LSEKRSIVSEPDLRGIYAAYIDCLNARDWALLGQFVSDDVSHNGRPLGLAGYRAMLENDVREIPDLRLHVELLVVEASMVASRLRFECSPARTFLGLDVGGRRIAFSENVFYAFRDGKIANVWSVIDKSAIEAQLPRSAGK
jgi:predicted ester cyclase